MATVKTLAISSKMVKLKSSSVELRLMRENDCLERSLKINLKSIYCNFVSTLASLPLAISQRLNIGFYVIKKVMIVLTVLLAISLFSGSLFFIITVIAIAIAIFGMSSLSSPSNPSKQVERNEGDYNYGSNGSNDSDGSTGS